MYFTKFESCTSGHVWFCTTSAHGNVCTHTHCAVSEQTGSTLVITLYPLNVYIVLDFLSL